ETLKKKEYSVKTILDSLDDRRKEVVQGVCLWRLRITYRTWYSRLNAQDTEAGFRHHELEVIRKVLNEHGQLGYVLTPEIPLNQAS
ncbi:MAG: hypothetical protein AAFP92_18400, partial [Bacteroidota bacterium]